MRNGILIILSLFILICISCKKKIEYNVPEALRIDLNVWSDLEADALFGSEAFKGSSNTTLDLFYFDNKVYASIVIYGNNSNYYLAEYDFKEWKIVNTAFSNKAVREIYKDHDGYYWVYAKINYPHNERKLYRFTGSIASPQNIEVIDEGGYFHDFYHDSKGRVWIAGGDGVQYYQNDSLIKFYFEESGEYCLSILQDVSGNMVFTTSEGAIWRFNDLYWERIPNLYAYEGLTPQMRSRHKLLFTSNTSIYTFDGINWEKFGIPTEGAITNLVLTAQNDFWYTDRETKKVYHMEGGQLINPSIELKINPNHELNQTAIRYYEDRVLLCIEQNDSTLFYSYKYN